RRPCVPRFPYTTLFRSALVETTTVERCRVQVAAGFCAEHREDCCQRILPVRNCLDHAQDGAGEEQRGGCRRQADPHQVTSSMNRDRKSTRLNSSHVKIS